MYWLTAKQVSRPDNALLPVSVFKNICQKHPLACQRGNDTCYVTGRNALAEQAVCLDCTSLQLLNMRKKLVLSGCCAPKLESYAGIAPVVPNAFSSIAPTAGIYMLCLMRASFKYLLQAFTRRASCVLNQMSTAGRPCCA